MRRVILASGVAAALSAAHAGPEAPASGGTTSPAAPAGIPQPIPAPAEAGVPYNEFFSYSAYARRSYAPGYTPHLTSLFENPRTYPRALCVMATPYYQYAGINGWFFGSPLGYQSSVPPNSHALAYFQGGLGITSNLRYGYPQGLRAIEPVIVPFNSYSERGGVFIQGGGLSTAEATAVSADAIPPAAPTAVAPPPTPLPAPGVTREK